VTPHAASRPVRGHVLLDRAAVPARRLPCRCGIVQPNTRVGACGETDEVLTEVLNHFAGLGPYWRGKAAALVHDLRGEPDVDVLPQTRADFDAALALYEARPDKGYSLTDCRSMRAMQQLGLTEALTNDHHFTQEGFTILFP
jgi:predicted nucleic acid-binding protein